MYTLLIKHFLRQRATQLAALLLLLLGAISLGVGRQFLDLQRRNIEVVEETQARHIQAQLAAHPDDLGLVLYYLKFAFIKDSAPLAGLAIGQSDLQNNIEHVTILALEGQKYDTDLVSPIKLQTGNLDLSFVITFLFPLVIIALGFNLWHEEVERGTWRMIQIQGSSTYRFLLAKLLIRWALVVLILLLLFVAAKCYLDIPLGRELLLAFAQSLLYLSFWFALVLCVVCLKRSSSVNAVVLLALWLSLTVLIPSALNSYITERYPVGEALELTLKQRDAYHHRWDSDKQATMERFNACYPQYRKYALQDSGFSWHWYYAMQHMGDLESAQERAGMLAKIRQREALSERAAHFLPPVQLQLGLNQLAGTDLSSYLDYLDATTHFHEGKRLGFYDAIFQQLPADSIDWSSYRPEHYQPQRHSSASSLLGSLGLITALLSLIGLLGLRRF